MRHISLCLLLASLLVPLFSTITHAQDAAEPAQFESWDELLEQAEVYLAIGDYKAAMDVLEKRPVWSGPGPQLPIKLACAPNIPLRWAWRDAFDLAQKAGDLEQAARAALGQSGADYATYGEDWYRRERSIPALETARELLLRVGAPDDLGRRMTEERGGYRHLTSFVNEARDALIARGHGDVAEALGRVYDVAVASESREAEREASGLCAQVVRAMPRVHPDTARATTQACALLACSLYGDELVEQAWVETTALMARQARDASDAGRVMHMAEWIDHVVALSRRPESLTSVWRVVQQYEQLVFSPGFAQVINPAGQEAHKAMLVRAYASAARIATSRGNQEGIEQCAQAALRVASSMQEPTPVSSAAFADLTTLIICCGASDDVRSGLQSRALEGLVDAWCSSHQILMPALIEESALTGSTRALEEALDAFRSACLASQSGVAIRYLMGVAAMALTSLERTEEARDLIQDACRRCLALGDPIEAALCLGFRHNLGPCDWPPDLLRPFYEAMSADPSICLTANGESVAMYCGQYGVAMLAQGDTETGEKALLAMGDGLRVTRDVLPFGGRADALLNAARAYAPTDRSKWALARQAYVCASEDDNLRAARAALEYIVALAAERGDTDEAVAAVFELIAIEEDLRGRLLPDPIRRRKWFARTQQPYEMLVSIASEADKPELALLGSEYRRTRTFLEEFRERQLDFDAIIPPELKQQRDRLRKLRSDVYAALAVGADATSPDDKRGMYMPIRGMYMPIRGGEVQGTQAPDADQLKEMLKQLAEDEAAYETQLREKVPYYAARVALVPPSIEALRRMVSSMDGVLVLEYSVARGTIVMVSVSPAGEFRVHKALVPSTEIDAKVEAYRNAAKGRDAAKESDLAKELWGALLSPFEAELAGARTVLIVADGALHLLPFEVLMGGDGQRLIERVSVAYAPSLTALGQAPPEGDRPEKPLLAMGSPQLAASLTAEGEDRGLYIPIRGGGGRESLVPARVAELARIPLPGAQAEVDALAEAVPGTTRLTGAAATEKAFREQAPSHRILHLATHAYADLDNPDYSTVLLSASPEGDPGLLQAFEVYDLRLNAELVTLSACDTGVGQMMAGEGILGLPRAFLLAGAHRVLCSLWPVHDEATSQLMAGFYSAITEGQDASTALRQAKLEMLANEPTSAPHLWAPFVIIEGPQG